MVRTSLTPIVAAGSYQSALTALTFTAGDNSNGNRFTPTGSELIIVWNSHATNAYTVTLTSVADGYGRLGTITAESVAAVTYKMFGPIKQLGWQQTDGYIYLDCENAAIKYCIITLPR